ncbi:electron transfer flavoprotein subunit alpha/FixB family protein [Pseudomonas sp. Marseille-Q7302]
MSSLIVAEHHLGQLKAATANVIMAARELTQPIELLLIGPGACAAAEQAAAFAGVERVLVAETAESCAPEVLAELIARLAGRRLGHVLAEASTQGRSVLPRVAALLDVGMIAEVIAIDSQTVFRRPIYAGNAIACVESLDEVRILTVRASAFAKAERCATPCPIVRLEEALAPAASRLVSEVLSTSARPELGSARVVVSGGRGLGSRENFALVERVADRLGGAVGASRAAVDAGFAGNDLQVGQTGKHVAPDLYLAVGISGAIQHLAGMSGSKVIVAINQDGEAPITQVADYTLVADLFEALPALERAL